VTDGDATSTGSSLARPVPTALLPPEDPTPPRGPRRTVRNWLVDGTAILLALLLGLAVFADAVSSRTHHIPVPLVVLDLALGGPACLALWWRRRWPVGIAVATALISAVSAFGAVAAIFAMFSVAVHRRTGIAIALAAVNLAAAGVFGIVRPQNMAWWVNEVIALAFIAVVTAWGMFVRARRQLIWTLRERAERAEAEQRMLAEQARLGERTRIAREMHDVLAHRISMMALHAGGLQLRPDLPANEIRETAELLRATAHQALEELRSVIGVLRDDSAGGLTDPAPGAPQPTLRDIPALVEQTRRAGAKIDFVMDVPPDAEAPAALGRDAYRIVQEALTNVAKHARGTATSVEVVGRPGDGLHVGVRNRLPLEGHGSLLPGSGTGLLGLEERVTLAGGTLRHGPDPTGDFVVDARLAWR
jgi:signal transduction histidine kinase